jgi:hypothetical protein
MNKRSEFPFVRRVMIAGAIIGAIVATIVPMIAGVRLGTEGLIAFFIFGAIFGAGSCFLLWYILLAVFVPLLKGYLKLVSPGAKVIWEYIAERFEKEIDLTDVEVPPVDDWTE